MKKQQLFEQLNNVPLDTKLSFQFKTDGKTKTFQNCGIARYDSDVAIILGSYQYFTLQNLIEELCGYDPRFDIKIYLRKPNGNVAIFNNFNLYYNNGVLVFTNM